MWIALGLAVLAVAGGWARLLGVRHGGRWTPAPPPQSSVETSTLDPADLDDVAARLDALDPTALRLRDELLVSRLRPLVDRRVPVRVVEPVAGLQAVRVRFADGTAVMGHGESPGDAGVLASMVRRQTVWIGSCSTGDRGMHVRFVLAGDRRRRLVFVVTGLDQPE